MKLFYLVRRDKVFFGQTREMVVRASDEASARQIASNVNRFDPRGVWEDAGLSTCQRLTGSGDAEAICVDTLEG